MPLTAEDLAAKTKAALDDLIEVFQKSPTLFYTENDLVCWMAAKLNDFLGDNGVVLDKDGLPHRLVHTEYPTPFRCSMAKQTFQIRDEEERTPKGGKYGRAHFDVVVLDPEFVAGHRYVQLNGQNLGLLQAEVFNSWTGPMLAYAIEFHFSRKVIHRGSVAGKVRDIEQDAMKLEAVKGWNEFVAKTQHVAFLKDAGKVGQTLIQEALKERGGIRLVFAPDLEDESAV